MTYTIQARRPYRDVIVQAGDRRAVQVWLAAVAVLVFAMIVVGGATRLTDSGLSITEWKPLLGAIPPLSEADWQDVFAKYKTIPQYASVNKGMTLDAFKTIFWWEWAHRFLGRIVGVVFAVPFVAFWMAGRLPVGWVPKLTAVFGLGALQGAVGWYMVSSGLAERIDVSQYRLALHLSIAFVILGALVWLILDLSPKRAEPRLQTLTAGDLMWAKVLAVLVFSQVVIGGFVAGLKAGRAFNTWPLMDGKFIPDGFARLEPWWLNLTENMATVQFNHRMAAYAIVALALWHALQVMGRADDERVSASAGLLAVGLAAQMGLGIWTVLAAVPIDLGIAHQGFAAIVFALAVLHAHRMSEAGK
ncbi:MAG: COX15/CtaA family protein [Hyphomicrobiaceae bacterium]